MVRSFWKVLTMAAVYAAFFFLIAACSGGGGGGGGGGGPISVSGIVVDSSNAPVSGANIILNHDNATLVTTGAGGTFSFPTVTVPYTLTMKSGTSIREYRDLSRTNPQLTTSSGGVGNMATLAGNVTGPTYPLSGQAILIGATNGVLTAAGANATTGAYSGPFMWTGNSAKTADIAALQFSYSGTSITGYIQTGTRTGVSLNNGVNQTGLDIALTTPVTATTTIFNYNAGAYNVGASGVYLILKANGAQFFVPGVPIPSGTTVSLPTGGATLGVSGSDAGNNHVVRIGTAVLGGTTTLDLPASTILKNSLPVNAATNVSKTPTLSWTPVSSVDMYSVSLSGGGFSYSFYVSGSNPGSLTIPDFTALGMPLASSTNYSWSVTAIKSGTMSTDNLADPASGGFNEVTLYQLPSVDLYSSSSTAFTTVP